MGRLLNSLGLGGGCHRTVEGSQAHLLYRDIFSSGEEMIPLYMHSVSGSCPVFSTE